MKSPAAYYLVLLYATVIFKPLIPFISDMWFHEFNEVEHISTIHAKYGSHHLQKEVADTHSENQKGQTNLKSEDEVQLHESPADNFCIYNQNFVQKYFGLYNQRKVLDVSLSKQSPPPEFS